MLNCVSMNLKLHKPIYPMKTALITGITGQDGAYLAELLLHKNYIEREWGHYVASLPYSGRC